MRRAPPRELGSPITLDRVAKVGDTLELGPAQLDRLAAREINVKEAFTFVDAAGDSFRASLKAAGGGHGSALVYEKMAASTESELRITLVCAVLGRQRMLTVVQKATELGCVRVAPVLSEHSVKPGELEKEKPWAWPGQAIRAARQCRRAALPEVLAAAPFAQALEAPWFSGAARRFALDDRAPAGVDPFAGQPRGGDLVLVVGPEGGWSDAERAKLGAAGAAPIALGARVLRAETAVFAGLAVVQHRLGDLR